jgi:hypothetical protein
MLSTFPDRRKTCDNPEVSRPGGHGGDVKPAPAKGKMENPGVPVWFQWIVREQPGTPPFPIHLLPEHLLIDIVGEFYGPVGREGTQIVAARRGVCLMPLSPRVATVAGS